MNINLEHSIELSSQYVLAQSKNKSVLNLRNVLIHDSSISREDCEEQRASNVVVKSNEFLADSWLFDDDCINRLYSGNAWKLIDE
jgi:hypothetical protein